MSKWKSFNMTKKQYSLAGLEVLKAAILKSDFVVSHLMKLIDKFTDLPEKSDELDRPLCLIGVLSLCKCAQLIVYLLHNSKNCSK